jgi:O-antigen/teichoic acid export membrane protein
LGFAQTRLRPSPIREAIRWWRTQAWPFGRWNGAATIVVNVASNASAFIIAGILGARALGGFRAVQSLFAPLSVIAPSLALPGLPAVARAYSLGFRPARDLALRVSAIAVAVSLSFFAVLFLGGWRLLPLLFGSAFERYRAIIPAMAVGQVLAAAGIGFPLLIKVQQRGRFLLTARLIATILGVIVVTIGAAVNGLMGATWGLAGASLIATAAVAVGAIEPRRPEVVRTRTGSVGPVP